jgi:GTPase SAR1 family protein
MYCRGSSGCLCVFDVTNIESFRNLNKWLSKFDNSANKPNVCILVANKSDYSEELWEVSRSKILSYATRVGLTVMFVSGKKNVGIEDLYENLVNSLIEEGIGFSTDSGSTYIDFFDDKLEANTTICQC